MREIVDIQVGYTGNRIGTKFWKELSSEHRIDLTGVHHGDDPRLLDRIEVYYDQTKDGCYKPRSILVDSHPRGMHDLVNQTVMFGKENVVVGAQGTSGCYAHGAMTYGPDLANQVIEKIRQTLEKCERPQGFHMSVGIGGGTGSGVGAVILGRFQEEFPEYTLQCSSVFPSHTVSDDVIQPYNAVLAMNHLTWNCDIANVYDYGAIYGICGRELEGQNVTFEQMADVCGTTMSTLTTSLRFHGDIYDNLKKMLINFVPFPKLHFGVPGFTPFRFKGTSRLKSLTTSQLIDTMFHKEHTLGNCDPLHGRIISAMSVFRGRHSLKEIDEKLSEKFNEINFSKWVCDNVKNVICDMKIQDSMTALATLTNTSAVADMFENLSTNFKKLWSKKAFVNAYIGEGMDTMEFEESHGSLLDLISEYRYYDDGDDSDDDSEDDTSDENADVV